MCVVERKVDHDVCNCAARRWVLSFDFKFGCCYHQIYTFIKIPSFKRCYFQKKVYVVVVVIAFAVIVVVFVVVVVVFVFVVIRGFCRVCCLMLLLIVSKVFIVVVVATDYIVFVINSSLIYFKFNLASLASGKCILRNPILQLPKC